MLATGGSAIAAVDILKRRKVAQIHFCCLIAAPEGIQRLAESHPDIQIHTTSVDQGLNEIGYILPGLGDAGDRAFNTEIIKPRFNGRGLFSVAKSVQLIA